MTYQLTFHDQLLLTYVRMESTLLLILSIVHLTFAKKRPKPGRGGSCDDCSWEYILIALGIVLAIIILYFLWKYYKAKKAKSEDDSKSIASEKSVKDHPDEALPTQPYPATGYPGIEPPPYPNAEQSYPSQGQAYPPYPAQEQPAGQPYIISNNGYSNTPFQPYPMQGQPDQPYPSAKSQQATEQPYPPIN